MKLVVNAAADSCSLPIRVPDPHSDRGAGSLFRRLPTALVALIALLGAGVAPALDGIDLSRGGAEVGVEGEGEASAEGCSRLFRIKYPFLSCDEGRIVSGSMSATWENSRRMPIQSEWIEGDGAWGPALNQD